MMEWGYTPQGALRFKAIDRLTPLQAARAVQAGGIVQCVAGSLKGCRFKWDDDTLWLFDLENRGKRGLIWQKWGYLNSKELLRFLEDRQEYTWILVES